jgi:hypothetical protein
MREELTLQFKVGLDRVAIGRPLVDGVEDHGVAVAVKDIVRAAWNAS